MCELADYFNTFPGIRVYMVILGKTDKFYEVPREIELIEPKFTFNNKFRFIYTIKTILFLRNTLKNINSDVVLSFGEMYNSFVLLSTLLLKQRVFVSDRSKPDKQWGMFHETLRRLLYHQAAGIICQTNYARDFMIAETRHPNIRIIPNPVKTLYQNHIARENIILNVGRLIRTKQIDVLIDCFSKIEDHGWQLWLVGDGPEREHLRRQVITLAIENRVRFLGNQANIAELYNRSKIFAFTSRSEGFPNALLEAMSAGLACIAFNCVAGPSELIYDGKNGFLVQEGDTEHYQMKLNTLVENEKLREKFSHAAITKAREFRIEKIGSEYLKFMSE